ncbi:VWA domain-containing protein [Rhodothalassium salexigens]|nr:VWA domain-containing protein [Rhodothalassium salexigens]MBB4210678.1 hypothetical protein [Rhodothalassium salexigens DSM 2132]MBK1637879.1 hypothetical protein [Rhodothalassium salexigens DSM 2132]
MTDRPDKNRRPASAAAPPPDQAPDQAPDPMPNPAPEQGAVDAFLAQVAATPARRSGRGAGRDRRGRLVFALDATMSRQPTWDRACQIQGDLFAETDAIGGLDVKLIFFRGMGECKASRWAADGATLSAWMTRVAVRGGPTQIGRVLDRVDREARDAPVDAVVYVGDCCEEDPDRLCAKAARLAARGTPLFMFHEGGNPLAGQVFRELARLTGGGYAPFDPSSPAQLRSLLRAAAVYAAGGVTALSDRAGGYGADAVKLLEQIR